MFDAIFRPSGSRGPRLEDSSGGGPWHLALPPATIQNAFNQLVSCALFPDGETIHKMV
jgi:hypothetical protein